MTVLVIAEHTQTHCDATLANLISCALQCGDKVQVCVMGYQCQAVAEIAARYTGVDKVLLIDDKQAEHALAEIECEILQSLLTKEYTHIIANSGTYGKNLLPRLAAQLAAVPVSDIITVHSANEFTRPIYAGNALERLHVSQFPIAMTVRANRFPPAAVATQAAPIETRQVKFKYDKVQFIDFQQQTKTARPELNVAKIVVSGGRGLQTREQFKLVETLADLLKAAVGASRAAVDAGIVPNDYQVGQTGKTVAPDLYIAIGISGAIQHIAGMKDSKIIVAINQDPDAPIFDIADYGLVGDLFKIVPEMISAIQTAKDSANSTTGAKTPFTSTTTK